MIRRLGFTLLMVVWFVGLGSASVQGMTPRELLEGTLLKLKEINTVSYTLDERTYLTQEDSFYYDRRSFLNTEYRNPEDTLGLVKFISFKPDSTFYRAYDGQFDLFYSTDYMDNYIESKDVSRQTIATVQSPFFNNVERLCEFLLTTDYPLAMCVEDKNDKWRIDAEVEGGMQIYIFGKPRAMWSPDGVVSRFAIEIDKNSLLADFLAFNVGYPQQRTEWRASEVKTNTPTTEDFNVEAHLPNLPILRLNGAELDKFHKEQWETFSEQLQSSPLPTDSLLLVAGGKGALGKPNGDKVTLRKGKGKVKLLLLCSFNCGYTYFVLPMFNKLREDYPEEEIMILGVMLQSNAQMEALQQFKENQGINFELAQDNGNFYRHYSPIGLSPVIIVIDPEDNLIAYYRGAGNTLYDDLNEILKATLKDYHDTN